MRLVGEGRSHVHSGNPNAVGLWPVRAVVMVHSSEWQGAGPCGQTPLVHALNLCLHVKIPLLSLLTCTNT